MATVAALTFVTAAVAGDDYPWQDTKRFPSGAMSELRFAYRNCTDFAAWRLNTQRGRTSAPWAFTWSSLKFPNGNGNASGWKQGAINSGYRVDTTPAVGSVAWWGPSSTNGNLGHVAIVTAVASDGRVSVEEYNFARREACGTRSGIRAEQYLHIADIAVATQSTPLLVIRQRSSILQGKVGPNDSWVTLGGLDGKIVAAGNRLTVLTPTGDLWAKDGLNGTWFLEAGGVSDFAVSG